MNAIRGLAEAFAARETREADPSSGGVWRLVAAGIEAVLAAPPSTMPTGRAVRILDDDDETIGTGDLAAFRQAARRPASVQTDQWNELLLDVARGAGRPSPLAKQQMTLKVEVSGAETVGVEAVSAVAEAATRLSRRAGELDGRFALLPTPAMTAALGALCLWDEYLQRNNLPDFREGNALQELAWRILEIGGVGADRLLPGAKSVVHKDGMERAIKVAAKVYVRLKTNPFLSPGKTGLWERQKVRSTPAEPTPPHAPGPKG